jgi:uncharacterized membrane protein (DUF2068 family)
MFVVDTEFVDTHCSAYLPVRIYQCVSTSAYLPVRIYQCVSTSAYLQIAYLQQQQFMPNLFLLSNRHLARH